VQLFVITVNGAIYQKVRELKKMTNKKRVDKWVYGFMTFLILLNSLTPLTSLAEERESPLLKLENVSKGQSETQLELTL
jgi:hypothetical protein